MFKYHFQDYYFKKAKKEGYKARSAFKLEEIQEKFHIFNKDTRTILDVGCAPGSWIQYAVAQLRKFNIPNAQIIWIDLKEVDLNLPWVKTYIADITDKERIKQILAENNIEKVDVIQSDMAPNTIGVKDVDAMRLFGLIESMKWLFTDLLKPGGKIVIKVFMGPGFEEFIKEMKGLFGGIHIKTLKPKSCRKASKEIYLIKF